MAKDDNKGKDKPGKVKQRNAKTSDEAAPAGKGKSGGKSKGKTPDPPEETIEVVEPEERKNPVLEKEDLKKLSAELNQIKARVFRYLFQKGYEVNDVHKACELILWPGLIYQQVYNSHVNWKKLKAKLQAERQKEK